MSHYYYFAATLPTLQFGAAAPMPSANFVELCERFVNGTELAALRAAVLSSPIGGAPSACLGVSPLLDGYYAWERSFRFALARLRAVKLNRSFATPLGGEDEAGAALARAAVQAGSPLEGELAIERARWAAIESLLGYDRFGFEAIAAYRLRLLSLERMASLEAERGEEGYRAVYAAILGAANTIDLTGDLR